MNAELYHVEQTALLLIVHGDDREALLRALTAANSGAGLTYAEAQRGELILVTFPEREKPTVATVRAALEQEELTVEECGFTITAGTDQKE